MTKHVHAELMMQYAQDSMETDKPWERWEFYNKLTESWLSTTNHPAWVTTSEYRRKPKMLSVTLANGDVVSWPEPIKHITEINDTQLWYLQGGSTYNYCNAYDNNYLMIDALKNGTLHLTEENAIQHIDALYKINNQHKDN